MDLRAVLDSYRDGTIDADEAEKLLRLNYIDSIGDDVLFDRCRELRKGIPEVVYARTKTPETVRGIASSAKGAIVISKASDAHLDALTDIPGADIRRDCGIAVVGEIPRIKKGRIGIITAGTSDVPVAREAQAMADAMGVETVTAFDVGVAGLHRLLEPMKMMIESDVDAIVVAAGMEGALATMVSSLSPVPVIGIPVSSGYGMGGNGEAAILGMLQSCALGLSVVNIDNGIGAGAMASLIARNRR